MSHRVAVESAGEAPSSYALLRSEINEVLQPITVTEATISRRGITRVSRRGVLDVPNTSLHGCNIKYTAVADHAGNTVHQAEVTSGPGYPVVAYSYDANGGTQVDAYGRASAMHEPDYEAMRALLRQTVFLDDLNRL